MSDNFSNSDDQKSKPNGLNSKEPLTPGTYDPNADLVIDKPRLRTIMESTEITAVPSQIILNFLLVPCLIK